MAKIVRIIDVNQPVEVSRLDLFKILSSLKYWRAHQGEVLGTRDEEILNKHITLLTELVPVEETESTDTGIV